MKTITCRQMGGMCDEPLSGNSYDDIMKVGWDHVIAAHPQMAKDIEAMPKDDPMMIKWDQDFRKTWADAPEN
jgi:hypothetical protein